MHGAKSSQAREADQPQMDIDGDSYLLFHTDFEMSADCVFHCHVIYGPHKVGG